MLLISLNLHGQWVLPCCEHLPPSTDGGCFGKVCRARELPTILLAFEYIGLCSNNFTIHIFLRGFGGRNTWRFEHSLEATRISGGLGLLVKTLHFHILCKLISRWGMGKVELLKSVFLVLRQPVIHLFSPSPLLTLQFLTINDPYHYIFIYMF